MVCKAEKHFHFLELLKQQLNTTIMHTDVHHTGTTGYYNLHLISLSQEETQYSRRYKVYITETRPKTHQNTASHTEADTNIRNNHIHLTANTIDQ